MVERRELSHDQQSLLNSIYESKGLGEMEVGHAITNRKKGASSLIRLQRLSLVHRSSSDPDTVRLLASSINHLDENTKRHVNKLLGDVALRIRNHCFTNKTIDPIPLQAIQSKNQSTIELPNILRLLQQLSLVASYNDSTVTPRDLVLEYESISTSLNDYETQYSNPTVEKPSGTGKIKRGDIKERFASWRETWLAAAMIIVGKFPDECKGKQSRSKDKFVAQSIVTAIYAHRELFSHHPEISEESDAAVKLIREWLNKLDPDYRDDE